MMQLLRPLREVLAAQQAAWMREFWARRNEEMRSYESEARLAAHTTLITRL